MASETTEAVGRESTGFVVKWAASVVQVLGCAGAVFGWTPRNLYRFIVGVLGRLLVGMLWNDRAIMLIHFAALGAMLAGMARQ